MYTCVVPIFILLMFWGRTLFQLWSSSSVWREGRERRRRRFRRFALFGNGSNRWTEHRQRFFRDGFFIFSLLRISYFLLWLLNRCHAMPCRSAWLPWIVIGQYIETIRLTTTTMLLYISYYYRRSVPSCMVICNIKYCIRSTHRPILENKNNCKFLETCWSLRVWHRFTVAWI